MMQLNASASRSGRLQRASPPRRAPRPCLRRRRPALAALDAATAAPALLGAAAVALLGAAGFRAALYSTLEYAKAAALARFVPRGPATPDARGAKVVLLGASTRDVFYLPSDTLAAVAVGADCNPSIFDQAGASAGVPTTGRRACPSLPWGGPDGFAAPGSLDAVVALGSALGKLSAGDRAACLREAVRALRPGRPLVLLQALSEGASPLRALVGPGGGGAGAMPAAELERALEDAGFAYVEWGVELQGTDPHALGVAVSPGEGDGEADARVGSGKRKRREPGADKKGF